MTGIELDELPIAEKLGGRGLGGFSTRQVVIGVVERAVDDLMEYGRGGREAERCIS